MSNYNQQISCSEQKGYFGCWRTNQIVIQFAFHLGLTLGARRVGFLFAGAAPDLGWENGTQEVINLDNESANFITHTRQHHKTIELLLQQPGGKSLCINSFSPHAPSMELNYTREGDWISILVGRQKFRTKTKFAPAGRHQISIEQLPSTFWPHFDKALLISKDAGSRELSSSHSAALGKRDRGAK